MIDIEIVRTRFIQTIGMATFEQIEQAAVWYFEAHGVAQDVAKNLGTSIEHGASVVAAFSPRERWSSNVAKSYAFSLGQPVSGLTNNLRMAQAAVVGGFDTLNGQKTNAFARAIAGDTQAVVIDVWMLRAAGLDAAKGVNKGDYDAMVTITREVAARFGLTPRTAQALIWIIVRGNHA